MGLRMKPEDAKALLDSGLISPETHSQMLQSETDSAGQSYSIGQPTSDVNALFPNVPKDAPKLAAISDYIPGVDLVKAAANKAADIGVDQANQNTIQRQSQAQEVIPGQGSEPALQNVQELPGLNKGAQKAAEEIAPEEEKYLKLAGDAQAKANKDVLDQQQQFFEDIKQNADDVNEMLSLKQDSLRKMQAQIEIDPTTVARDRILDSPVIAGIGILLSGIGSGLSGQQNAALGVYNKAIDQAIQKKSQNIQALYNKSQSYGQAAEGYLNKSQVISMSNQVAAATTYRAAEGYVAGIANQLQSATAKQRAMFLKNELGQKAQIAENSVLEITKGSGAYQDTRKANAVGDLIGFGIPDNANQVLQGQPQQRSPSALPEYLVPKAEEAPVNEAPKSMIEKFAEKVSGSKKAPF
jgi:hypothetical protein